MTLPAICEVEKAIGTKAAQWKARCFEISSHIVESGLVPGRAVYGHYRGPVSARSMFYAASKIGFVRHGWISTPGGRIVDPTRWVFEHTRPYLYEGPQSPEYDEGGNVFRATLLRPPPPCEGKLVELAVSSELWRVVAHLLGDTAGQLRGVVSVEQLLWIANLPLGVLGAEARAIYRMIDRADQRAFIPIDNWRAIFPKTIHRISLDMRERLYSCSHCGALAGEPCHRPSGQRIIPPHHVRGET